MVLIQLLLPTRKGNGSDAMMWLGQTRHELETRFNGVTAYVRSPAKGSWVSPQGQTETDDVVMVEVVTQTFDRGWWRVYMATLARRFGQEAIHVRALPIEMADEEE